MFLICKRYFTSEKYMKKDHIYQRYSIVTFGDTILTYPVLINDKPSNVYVSDG